VRYCYFFLWRCAALRIDALRLGAGPAVVLVVGLVAWWGDSGEGQGIGAAYAVVAAGALFRLQSHW
jgi:hypothetical protein